MPVLTTTIKDIMLRCCAIEKEAFAAAGISCDAYPFFRQAQNSVPYFIHRLGSSTYDYNTEAVQTRAVTIEIYMAAANRVEGYSDEYSETEDRLFYYIELVRSAFLCQNRSGGLPGGAWLCSETYPTLPLYLTDYYLATLGATLTGDSGYRELTNSGTGASQVGTVFTLNVPVFQQIGGV